MHGPGFAVIRHPWVLLITCYEKQRKSQGSPKKEKAVSDRRRHPLSHHRSCFRRAPVIRLFSLPSGSKQCVCILIQFARRCRDPGRSSLLIIVVCRHGYC